MDWIAQRKRSLIYVLAVILILACVLPFTYCCGIPLLTGQACLDLFSGHVPTRALDRFLDRLFEATVARDYEWLATVSDDGALEQLRQAQPSITTGYEIVLQDNLGGMYEYRIRFDNGATVYVTLNGEWPDCPDFSVTEEEIFQHIRLTSIQVESD
jgi:hypothetical protein